MPVYADPREIERLALQLTRAAIQCRDLGHNWRTRNVEVEAGGYKRTFRCTRGCQVVRIQKLDRSARVKSNNYDYPKTGYLFGKPVGRIVGDAKAAIRLQAIYMDLERLDTDGANTVADLRSQQASGNGKGRGKSASRGRGRARTAS